MKISFVIPTRNEEENIGKTIESILALPDEHVKEIIIADNGSSDRTAEIAAKYPKTKVIREPIPGTNRARQTGFLASTGDVVAFIDADNHPTVNWSQLTLKYLSRPGVAAIAGTYSYRDQNPIARFLSFYGFLLIAYPVYFIVHHLLRLGSVVQGGNMAINRWALEKIGGLDVSYTFYGDDVHTGKRLRRHGKVLFVPNLITTASARRFRKHGYFSTIFKYFMNFAWVILFDKPFTRPKK